MPHTNNKRGRTDIYRDKQASRTDSGFVAVESMFTDHLGGGNRPAWSGDKIKDMKYTKRGARAPQRGGKANGQARGDEDGGLVAATQRKQKAKVAAEIPLIKAKDVNFNLFAQEVQFGETTWKAFKEDGNESFCKLELKAVLNKEPRLVRITINEKGTKNTKLRTTINLEDVAAHQVRYYFAFYSPWNSFAKN